MTDLPADRLAKALAHHGADTAFGVPGGGPNLDVVGAMSANGIRFVLAHGETAACIMASVYGRLTGRLSAAVVTRGPGAASAVNGAAQATLDRHPLVLITDTVPSQAAAAVPHQRLDQRAMLGPVVKASLTLGSDPGIDDLTDILGLASTAPAGAIHIDYDTSIGIDTDISIGIDIDTSSTGTGPGNGTFGRAGTPVGGSEPGTIGVAGTSGRFDPTNEPTRRVRAIIEKGRRPVVVVGLGAVVETARTPGDRIDGANRPGAVDATDGPEAAGQRLRQALERFGAPVLTTYQAAGAIPSEHRLAAGLFTNGASERRLLEQADVIIAVGLDLVEPIPAPWTYQAPVVSLAPAPTVDRYLPIEAELIGDPVALAGRVLSGHHHRWPDGAGADHRQAVRAELAARGHLQQRDGPEGALGPLDVVEVAVEAVTAATSGDARFTTTVDAGAHFLAVMPFWPVAEPNRLLISNGLATMGYAVPAAIAAALARPGEPVMCFVGDGGLGMTLAELETIARLELPITVVVFNDSALSLIRIKQQAGHGGSEVVSYRPTDFASLAIGMGLKGVAVKTRAELGAALGQNWGRSVLIDARIDPTPYAGLIEVTRG